jgi:hypothetical protein
MCDVVASGVFAALIRYAERSTQRKRPSVKCFTEGRFITAASHQAKNPGRFRWKSVVP